MEHNTGKLQGLVQNVYDILVVLLVEEYFSRSTIHDQAFFFFSYSLRKLTPIRLVNLLKARPPGAKTQNLLS